MSEAPLYRDSQTTMAMPRSASEQRWDNLKRLKGFHLNAKARIWS